MSRQPRRGDQAKGTTTKTNKEKRGDAQGNSTAMSERRGQPKRRETIHDDGHRQRDHLQRTFPSSEAPKSHARAEKKPTELLARS